MPVKFIILFCCCFVVSSAKTQNQPAYRFLNFGYKDGLPEKAIYCTVQDKQGYMWFGTATGLYRYDGLSFKQFRSSIDKAGSNISNILQSVGIDSNGNIWLGSLNDLQWYNPAKNIFWRTRRTDAVTKKLLSSYIVSFSNSGSNMWINTSYNQFYRFNSADSGFTSYSSIFPATASKTTIKVLEHSKRFFAVHTEGLYEFTDNTKPALLYPLPYAGDEITNAAVTSQGITITTLLNGVQVFNTQQNKFAPSAYNSDAVKKNNVFCVAENNRQLWTGSYPLFKCSEKGAATEFNQLIKDEFDLAANKIGSLYFDREKNLWICSYNGLSMLPWQNQQISNTVLKDVQQNNLIEPTGIWGINGSNNIAITNTSTKGLVIFNTDKKEITLLNNPVEKNNAYSRIIGAVQKKDGSLYFSDDKNFYRYNAVNNQLTPVHLHDQNDKPIINVGRNVTDSKGNVFISSIDNGFYKWNADDEKLFHYNKNVAEPEADIKADNALYPSCADRNDNIWFTSNTGIYQFIQNQNRWRHYTAEGLQDVPPMTKTQYITEDQQGHIWIATVTNGLYELYFENGKEQIRNYSKTSGIGLNTDYCIKLKPDKKQNILWLSTHLGIHRFDPVAKKILSTLTVQNGLAKEGGGYTFNITDDNLLVILFYGACSVIDLNSYQFNTNAPVVAFNSVKVLNKEMLFSITDSTLVLDHNQNYLQFDFAAMQFNNSNQFQYAYMMQGADKDWVYTNRNDASFSGLSPGTYFFKVKAANNDGVWSNSISTLKIIIKNPFWKTWWFISLCGLLLGVVLYSLYRLRMQHFKREEKLKSTFTRQIADMEMRALRAQMNPHFIFNSLNSIQKYILKNEHFAASQYLTKFSRLIRLILDHSNQNNILLSSEMELLHLYCEMESLRFDNKFTYNITTANDLHADTVEIPSMLIQPYVENAIWHGLLHKDEPGVLKINFIKTENNSIRVTVEDDGVGRQKAAELKSKQVLKKKSYGMQITQDRIAVINRLNNINATSTVVDLHDVDGNAAGTKIIIEIPLKSI